MTSERTPQDVLRELRREIEALTLGARSIFTVPTRVGPETGWNTAIREVLAFIDKAIAEAPDSPPPGTRLVLVAEELLGQFGTRTERGEPITAEWGEPDEHGWYTPTFRVHPAAPDTLSEKPGLDVERLAKAIVRTSYDLLEVNTKRWHSANEAAAVIAAEYDRLGSTDSEGRYPDHPNDEFPFVAGVSTEQRESPE